MAGFATRRPDAFPWARFVQSAVVLTPLALFSGAYSLAVATDTGQPQVSQQFYSELPRAKARLGDIAIAEAVTAGVSDEQAAPQIRSGSAIAASLPERARRSIERRALSSLLDTPYSPAALRQLAFVEPDEARRRDLLGLARRVSRRDLSTAAQAAELQFADGDYETGLATLEQALDISDALDARIFPIMLRASREDEFENVLSRALARGPAWAERLAAFASTNPQSSPDFARLAHAVPRTSRALSLDYGGPLIDGLARSGQLDTAFEAYAAYSRGGPDIAAFGTRPLAPLDWQLADNIESGARLIGSDDATAELFAEARRSGEAARIVLRLPPGAHRLSIDLSDLQGSGGELQLTRTCLHEGRESESLSITRALTGSRVSLPFSVEEDCPFQLLRLSVEAKSERVSVLVSRVSLERGT